MTGFSQPFEGQKVMGAATEMASLRRQYWDMNLGDPFGFCFVSGTQVSTDMGRINIEDIKRGDHVISLDGRLHKVISLLHKKSRDLYKIKLSTIHSELCGTSTHHIPVFKRVRS